MRSAPERFTRVVELTTHTAGLDNELRGSDIPSDVQGIFLGMPTAGKSVLRRVKEYAGNNAPSIGGLATISAGGKGRNLFANKKSPRTPVLLKTTTYASGEGVVLKIPPADGSYRFRSNVTVYGLIP